MQTTCACMADRVPAAHEQLYMPHLEPGGEGEGLEGLHWVRGVLREDLYRHVGVALLYVEQVAQLLDMIGGGGHRMSNGGLADQEPRRGGDFRPMGEEGVTALRALQQPCADLVKRQFRRVPADGARGVRVGLEHARDQPGIPHPIVLGERVQARQALRSGRAHAARGTEPVTVKVT